MSIHLTQNTLSITFKSSLFDDLFLYHVFSSCNKVYSNNYLLLIVYNKPIITYLKMFTCKVVFVLHDISTKTVFTKQYLKRMSLMNTCSRKFLEDDT